MSSENLEDLSLVWLDGNLDKDRDRRIRLRGVINYVKQFENSDECIQYITSKKNEKIFFIVSGTFGQSVIPIIHDMAQIVHIYIHCLHENFHEQLAGSYTKVQGVFIDTSDLYYKLTDDAVLCKETLPPPMTVCKFSGMKEQSVQDLDKESATFLWFQILVETLLRLPDSNTIAAKNDMLDECRSHYIDNETELKKIEKFGEDYSRETALQWYTRDSFVYRLINRAFRTENIDIIFKFRFFITDLFNQMSNIHNHSSKSSDNLIVYRGQLMGTDELKKIQESIGNLISINTFFSTTKNYDVALVFAGDGNESLSIKSVVFQIDIDTNIVKNPFVYLSEQSNYKDEEEILLSMGFIFRIVSVEKLSSGHWFVSLIATNEQDVKTNELISYLKSEIGETSSLLQLGGFLSTMGEYDKSRRYYEILLKQIPDNHIDRVKVYNDLGLICMHTSDLTSAASYFEKGLELGLKNPKPDGSSLALTYNNIGGVYYNRGIYEQAIENYIKALNSLLVPVPLRETNSLLGKTHNNLGLAYTDQGDYRKANDHLEKALTYKTLALPKNHPNIASTYANIGGLHFDNDQYDKALENYEKALEICRLSLPEHHQSTAKVLNNIGLVYQKQGDQTKASNYFKEGLACMEKSLSEEHTDFALVYNNLGLVEYAMKNWDTALDYYEKAAKQLSRTLGPDHPSLATIYYNIGQIYNNGKADQINARSYYGKALAIAIKAFSPDHRDIELYRNTINQIQQKDSTETETEE